MDPWIPSSCATSVDSLRLPVATSLDPFMGSGSTGKAAMLERFDFIGIELSEEYMKIAEARIEAALKETAGKLL